MSEITPEESTNQTETPYFKAPENHAHFALVIDGKLSWLHSVLVVEGRNLFDF